MSRAFRKTNRAIYSGGVLPVLLYFLLRTAAAAAAPPVELRLAAPVERWDEALPLGNGLTGGLLWGRGNEIFLSLDRGDLWDVRAHPAFVRPGFDYATVVKLASSGQADLLNKEYSRVSDYPAKLPGARLVLKLDPRFQAASFVLDLQNALGAVEFAPGRLECFFSATHPVAMLFAPGPAPEMRLMANEAVRTLGYEAASPGRDAQRVWLLQKAAQGFQYAILADSRPVRGGTLVAISLTTSGEDPDPLRLARQRASDGLSAGFAVLYARHRHWWKAFWEKSSISLPDEKILQHYRLVQYFYGAASRRGAPPMPLQGVWTADEGKLPPWHGDYHHDLNTQLTYWAYLAAGHFEEGRAFLDFMWNLKPRHEEFARTFWGLPGGMIVPGVMSLDGKAMGAWFPYTLSPTMGAWVAQAFYWHWRYEMDPEFLSGRAYPYCAAIGEALAALLKADSPNGRLRLPLSSSPEIHNNTQQAWMKPNTNFDLSLLRWLFSANAEMAEALSRPGEANRWRELPGRLDPLAAAADTGALMVSPEEPLAESHRHHSHLMAIHPLGLVTIEAGPDDRRQVRASLAEIDRLGTGQWCGYSFSWMAAMRARVGEGREALRYLADYLGSFVSRNGFHLNGEQTRRGLTRYRDRAFTLEGNFAAAQAVHEMLLQSWGGRLRVFPAVPEEWTEASFERLRAEGGFQVTAERKEGRTVRVAVRAGVSQSLRLEDPFGGRRYRASRPVQKSGSEIRAALRAGETLELRLANGAAR